MNNIKGVLGAGMSFQDIRTETQLVMNQHKTPGCKNWTPQKRAA